MSNEEVKTSEDWRTLANLVSMVRLLFAWVPAAIILVGRNDPVAWWWAAGIFTVVVLTDALDGYLARSRNEATKLGAFLDPLVDKVLVVMTLVALSIIVPYIWIPTAIIILHEVVVALQLRAKGVIIPAAFSGKLKMFVQAMMIIVLLMPIGGDIWDNVRSLFVGLAIGATLNAWIDSTRTIKKL
jgi:CDP-diacylglycerol--glycerol-3-phosphate 3-phosphatidyltransferase